MVAIGELIAIPVSLMPGEELQDQALPQRQLATTSAQHLEEPKSRLHLLLEKLISAKMPVAFGFSMGDFVAGIALIRDLIKALEDGAGSGVEYRELIRELFGLERALLEVKQLAVPEALIYQKNALNQAACQC